METIRGQLEPDLIGRTVVSGWGFDSPKFSDAPLARGAEMAAVRRRGKYLLVDLAHLRATESELVVHLGMTGRLAVTVRPPAEHDTAELKPRHLRAWWALDDGRHLGFWDQRRFGRIAVVARGDHRRLPTLADLGPEPFSSDFTPEHLRSGLGGRRALKSVLLDQRLVAGIGNIYADEALWLAGISPAARRLGADRSIALHRAIISVLQDGLEDGGTTLRDYRDASGAAGKSSGTTEMLRKVRARLSSMRQNPES